MFAYSSDILSNLAVIQPREINGTVVHKGYGYSEETIFAEVSGLETINCLALPDM